MSWAISWEKRALKELAKLDRQHRTRVVEAVEGLAKDPFQGTAIEGQWEGLRRLRVGSYRVIYALDRGQLLVLVLRVGHRREVYR
ncbi:MAG: addiction module toxin RelE [Nitrospirae bacterium RBG_16_64_22]|nr:MAG: addiction module toxin RelE [Nitrospirae bacterium RBG_16_64_22]